MMHDGPEGGTESKTLKCDTKQDRLSVSVQKCRLQMLVSIVSSINSNWQTENMQSQKFAEQWLLPLTVTGLLKGFDMKTFKCCHLVLVGVICIKFCPIHCLDRTDKLNIVLWEKSDWGNTHMPTSQMMSWVTGDSRSFLRTWKLWSNVSDS